MNKVENMPELREYPKRKKKARAKKRKLVGYDKSEPEMCQNCKHFKKALHARYSREYFPPLCVKHEFEVDLLATCNEWQDVVT